MSCNTEHTAGVCYHSRLSMARSAGVFCYSNNMAPAAATQPTSRRYVSGRIAVLRRITGFCGVPVKCFCPIVAGLPQALIDTERGTYSHPKLALQLSLQPSTRASGYCEPKLAPELAPQTGWVTVHQVLVGGQDSVLYQNFVTHYYICNSGPPETPSLQVRTQRPDAHYQAALCTL